MSIERKRTELGNGIALTELIDKKLKTNSFLIHFIAPLTNEIAAANAAVPIILTDSSEDHPTLTAVSRRLAELYGASLRGGVSRFGDCHVVSLSASCIADRFALENEELALELIKMFTGNITRPHLENGVFCEDDFRLKKQELLDDIDADINEKRSYALKQAGKIIFENEAAGISPKGERAAAEQLTSSKTYDAYRNLLLSARIELFYVGSGISDKARAALISAFESLERKDVFEIKLVPSPVKAAPVYKTERLDIVQSKMVIAYKTAEDRPTEMKLFNALFGGTPFSLLFENVREKLSLCYYCSSSYNPKKQVLYIDSGVESCNIEAAEAEIKNQLQNIISGDFSDDLIAETKLAIINALKAVNDSPRAVAEWYFKQCTKPESEIITPEDEIAMIEKITREDIIACAKSLKLDTVYVLTGKEC